MNKLEEQLDYLNYQAELHRAKGKRGVVSGNIGIGYSVCMCSSENFINYSSHQWSTRAAFVSTWLIGFNAAEINPQFFDKYNFLTLSTHSIADNCCPCWIVSPRLSKKTFYNYPLMWDYFEEALVIYKEECSNHKEMYCGMTECIERMEDEEASGSLIAALNYVFKDELVYLQEPSQIFIR
tara:strand:- start:365 stop:907 length:543 start_codon:yes stop_codon:yes gene_type:complete